MGVEENFIKCHECGYTSARDAKFCDLLLPVKNEFEQTEAIDSVERAIFKYLCPETLSGDNAYSCSGCENKVTASKGARLQRLPKILTL